jgi:tetratricopeptide (TPR) repeat protein
MPLDSRHVRPLAIALAMLLAALTSRVDGARAEDIVVVRSTSGAAPSRIAGQVVDFTGSELRVRLASGRERVIRTIDVDAVETSRCAEHVAGDKLFADGDFALAEAKYRAAVETDREVRGWVRRQILAQIVWCQQSTAKWEQAADTFLALVKSDPQTQYFDCIPLAWVATQPTTTLEKKAHQWLAAGEPTAALIGASHLVATARRPLAVERLRSLAHDSDPRVAWLAQAQLWRIEAVRAGQSDLDLWSQAIDASDESLRAGPYFVLGSALAAHDPDGAAMALLQLPLLYPRHRRLAAAALLLAGGCLEKAGRPRQAVGLYRELVEGHKDAAEATDAKRRLEGL